MSRLYLMTRRFGGFVPGQQRPPGDPVQIAHGKALYGRELRLLPRRRPPRRRLGRTEPVAVASCAQRSKRRTDSPIIQGSRQDEGMPAIPISPEDGLAVAAYIRSVVETIGGQGKPPSVGKKRPASWSAMRRRPGILRRKVRQLPFRDGRSAGDRGQNHRPQGAADHLGWRWLAKTANAAAAATRRAVVPHRVGHSAVRRKRRRPAGSNRRLPGHRGAGRWNRAHLPPRRRRTESGGPRSHESAPRSDGGVHRQRHTRRDCISGDFEMTLNKLLLAALFLLSPADC
jgi:hypothetical protein